jgi:hypothetical protein
LWFRSCGERNANLRRKGLNIDIRGEGGLILTPPSVRAGVGVYRIERGCWDDLAALPHVAAGAIPAPASTETSPASKGHIGGRHDLLFAALRVEAQSCETLGELISRGHAINAEFTPPIGSDDAGERGDIEKTAGSVWNMKSEGRLLLPGRQGIWMTCNELVCLRSDAFHLLGFLRKNHAARCARGQPFALSTKAMARDNVIPGWGRKRYNTAIHELLHSGAIRRAHKGGRYKGDVSLFYVYGVPERDRM